MTRVNKSIAILLAVLFLVSLTASAVSASPFSIAAQKVSAKVAIAVNPAGTKVYDNGVHQIGTSDSNSLLDYLLNIFKELLNTLFGNSDIKTEAKVIPFAPIER